MRQPAPFGEQLRRLRERAGLTQEELAERAGLTSDAVGALERGKRRRPYPHTVRALADALGLEHAQREQLLAAVPRPPSARLAPSLSPEVDSAGEGAPPTGLPGQLTELIGRERETALALQLLGRPGVRLLTLSGPGGVGKTRLALAVAERAAADFPDGLAFVPLAPLRDPGEVPGAITAALGARAAAGASPLRHLTAALRDKRLLLVLDNCEHVVDAAPAVTELLVSCPYLKVLATSRVPLRVRGEQGYQVPPLWLPHRRDIGDIPALLRSPAVQLFVARAQAALPEFEVTLSNNGAVAAICARLEGLPLALELAAARVALLPPPVLLARLERGLGVLTGGARDLPDRQRTMRDAIAWSHDLLDPAERALFRCLAVFVGSATLDAVEAVCGGEDDAADDVLGRLAVLLDNNLLAREVRDGEDDAGEPRVRMLEPIRGFALEQLAASGELAALQRRHAVYYHALAVAAGPHLTRPEQVGWLGRLEREQYNLRAAVRALLGMDEAEAAAGLVWALWRYWRLSGQQREARRWAEEALTGGTPSGSGALSPQRRAQALVFVGMAAQYEGDNLAARAALEEGLRLCRMTGEGGDLALALLFLGHLALSERDTPRAQARLEESLRLFHTLGEEWGASFALTHLGILPLLRGDYEGAARWLEEGLATAREAGDRVATHQALYYLGLLARARGDEGRAAEHFAAGLALAEELRDRLNAGYFVKGLAEVAAGRGRATEAVRLLGAAEAVLQATGSAPYRYVSDWLGHERAMAARASLGDAAFDAAWAAGRALPLEEAIAEAMAVAAARP